MRRTEEGLVGARIELSVGAVAHGGHCVARHDGRVVFVRHALPGEQVSAVVTEEHATFLRADTVAVHTPSPHRVPAPCAYAGRLGREGWAGRPCGGCDWQHADLAHQRELKSTVLREQLRRLGGLSESEVAALDVTVRPVPAVAGEPDGLGWRTRVQYTVDSTGRAGLLAHRSHEVVPVQRCLLAHATVREADVPGRTWPEHDIVEVAGGSVLARRAGGAAQVVSGPQTLLEWAVGRPWRLDPAAFWQVHPSAADTLAADVVQLLAPRPGDRIWDLYGGAGLFAAALAPHAGGTGRITIVEGDAAAVAAARENLADLTTVTVKHADVATALRNPRWRSVDLVVLDPPRSGAGAGVVDAIAGRRPRAVAYVACDPAALARDAATLRSYGYRLAALRAYDLFPMTHHLECVALFACGAQHTAG